MLLSLQLIEKKPSIKEISEVEIWLKFLKYTRQKSYNLKNVEDLSTVSNQSVLQYVVRTLRTLENYTITNSEGLTEEEIAIIEEILKRSEVAKCGNQRIRKQWEKSGYDLFVHNLSSAEIYREYTKVKNPIVYILIQTHGLLGQYVKGEVNLNKNVALTQLIGNGMIDKIRLEKILKVLNYCILEGVREKLYFDNQKAMEEAIQKIINSNYTRENFQEAEYILNRMKNIFKKKSEEDFLFLKEILKNEKVCQVLGYLFQNFELWYIDSALEVFSMEEITKILLLVSCQATVENHIHINFELIMKEI